MPPGPAPKRNPARRNKQSTRAVLVADHDVEAPPLPDNLVDDEGLPVDWHPLTIKWWADIWASPMAPEFVGSDIHGLYLLAALVDQFWHSPSTALAAEIRLQRQCFGLTPIDRRRLQWEISRGDDAAEKTRRRRAPAAAPKAEGDPYAALRAV